MRTSAKRGDRGDVEMEIGDGDGQMVGLAEFFFLKMLEVVMEMTRATIERNTQKYQK